MYEFEDIHHNNVVFSFEDHPFSKEPKHVWVICTFEDKWLLTQHRNRGLEFPGGKVEVGESALEAAIREVKEETGGIVTTINYIGQYKVSGKEKTIIKNVYFAEIAELVKQESYFETHGPILLKTLPDKIKQNGKYSFIMKDDVLPLSLNRLKESNLL
ncbi:MULTISPECIES: RNA deprotection pyrophosphohydrolase [Bacillus]|uniref:RNA deprotection pyrophosphohydrolase n=1 Tax=Bacillus TaxID=1386 RepID=UPI000BB69232|nr:MULTISPECIES: nucleoside triphosphatase YtkD [Bacillus]